MIIGAGLSGLIAAHAFPSMKIIEADQPKSNHKALLRFRSDAVSRITNIPFQKVTVRKAVFDTHGNEFVQPNIALANQYSVKVSNSYIDRSIWNIETVTRFIAPEDFYDKLVDFAYNRIQWGVAFDPMANPTYGPIISTVPLSVMAPKLGFADKFQFLPISVRRFRVDCCHTFQTIYFPRKDFPVYRASITSDLLIVEFMNCDEITDCDLDFIMGVVCEAFGIEEERLTEIDVASQRFGKIAPIPEMTRKAMIRRLTTMYNIYSLGRFATWRNVLLDDVVKDIDVIKQLITSDEYDASLLSK